MTEKHLTQHERIVRAEVLAELRQTKGIIQVNIQENPGLKEWVEQHPRLKPLEGE